MRTRERLLTLLVVVAAVPVLAPTAFAQSSAEAGRATSDGPGIVAILAAAGRSHPRDPFDALALAARSTPPLGHTVTHDEVHGYADVSFTGLPAIRDDGSAVAHRVRVDEQYHATEREARVEVVSARSNARTRTFELGRVGELGEDRAAVRAAAARLERRATVIESRLSRQRYRSMVELGTIEDGPVQGATVRVRLARDRRAVVVEDAATGRERLRVRTSPAPPRECEANARADAARADAPDSVTVWYDPSSGTVALLSRYDAPSASCEAGYRFDVAQVAD